MKGQVPHNLLGGMDLSIQEAHADPSTFGSLVNFRQRNEARGELQQTPYFYASLQLAQRTYWDADTGASATEPTGSAVRLYAKNSDSFGTIYGTDYSFETASAAIQTFYQTAYPTSVSINTNCFIVINSVSGLGLTLGNTLDIVIDGATTFKWRKNGAAFTTLQPCTITGTAIDGGNVTVYFLATSGFTINDTWSWKRMDTSRKAVPADTVSERPLPSIHYKGDLFIVNNVNRVCILKRDDSATAYVISVGYRPVYGRYIRINGSHLFVGAYATTSSGTNTSSRLVCSDNLDLMNFFSTSTNEADEFQLSFQSARAETVNRIIGLTNIGEDIYAISPNEVFKGTYLGLPNVYTFTRVVELPFKINWTSTSAPVVDYDGASVFIIADEGPWKFDGVNFQYLGQALDRFLGGSSYAFGTFDSALNELIIVYNGFLIVYQLRYGTWYVRLVDFDSYQDSVTFIAGSDGTSNGVFIGIRSRYLLREDSSFANTPVKDTASGTLWASPYVVTQLYTDGSLARVKEIESCYVAVRFRLSATSSNYYGNPDTKVQAYWRDAANGAIGLYDPISGFVTNANAFLTSASADGVISFPRVSFRALGLQFMVTGPDATKPAGAISIVFVEPVLIGLTDKTPTR